MSSQTMTIASSLIPSWRRAHRTSVLSELSEYDLMEHVVSFCERNNATSVLVNKQKLKMKATFPSGLCIFFNMYIDFRMISEHHGYRINCFYLQKQDRNRNNSTEFRNILNNLRAELKILDPMTCKHYTEVRRNGGKALQKQWRKSTRNT